MFFQTFSKNYPASIDFGGDVSGCGIAHCGDCCKGEKVQYAKVKDEKELLLKKQITWNVQLLRLVNTQTR